MNPLAITLYVLMEAVLIMAKTERLPANTKLLNPNKIAVFGSPLQRYPQSDKLDKLNKLYSYSYNTDTGIQAQEDGHLNYIDTEQEALEARGSYGYTDAEGNTFQVSYVANENGFQPEGAHLPIASLIKKALQYIAKHPEQNGEQ